MTIERDVTRLITDVMAHRLDVVARQRCIIEGLCRLVGAPQGAASRWTGFRPDGNLKLVEVTLAGEGPPADHVLARWKIEAGNNYRQDLLILKASEISEEIVTTNRRELLLPSDWDQSEFVNKLPALKATRDIIGAFYRRKASDGMSGMVLYRLRGDPPFGRRARQIVERFNVELGHLHKSGWFSPVEDLHSPLSNMQESVLKLLIAGKSDKCMQKELDKPRSFVAWQTREICGMFGVTGRSELLAKFLQPLISASNMSVLATSKMLQG